jgi:hypothetical protein
MQATSSSTAGSRAQAPAKGQPLPPIGKFGTEFFHHLHETSGKHDGKAARLFSRNYLRPARLYRDVKDGKLAGDEKLKAVRDIFEFLGEGRINTSVEKQAMENLQTLSTALNNDKFKTGTIQEINTAVVQFSKFLYEPGKKTPHDISEKTQALFKSLFELVQGKEIHSAGENLCKMINSATALANMEMLLPSNREEAINKFTVSAQKFIDSIFDTIETKPEFNHAKAIFKDAVYLAVVNAGLLMCYEQKSGLDKLRLLVKRSFVPFAYVCTKAEGIAAGFLTTKVGAAMGTAISGALASTVGKVGIGALAIKFSVPIIFFVGSGALGLAITYGLYKLSEKSSNDLRKSLDGKIKAKKEDVKKEIFAQAPATQFSDDQEPEQTSSLDARTRVDAPRFSVPKAKEPPAAVTDPILFAKLNSHGDTRNLSATQKSQNPTINPVRSGRSAAKEVVAMMNERIKELEGVFSNSIFASGTEDAEKPAWATALMHCEDKIKEAQKSRSKSAKATAVQDALVKFINSIASSLDPTEQKIKGATGQELKVGKLLALFHQYINESDRYTIADFSKRVEDLYKLAGEIAQATIGTTVPNDEGESTERKDLVAYLQFHIYNAGFAISANHRSLSDKSKRYASILIAPACNSLLKVETMGVAAVSQMLVEPHITNGILQFGIDSVASVALGIPFVALGIALGAWTLVKADKADDKGIKTLNPMVRDYVKVYLEDQKTRLEADKQNVEKGFIEKLIIERELEKVKVMLNQIAAAEHEEFQKQARERNVITLAPPVIAYNN